VPLAEPEPMLITLLLALALEFEVAILIVAASTEAVPAKIARAKTPVAINLFILSFRFVL
jgi:hypothetical protein